jgi:hypothetical protein
MAKWSQVATLVVNHPEKYSERETKLALNEMNEK